MSSSPPAAIASSSAGPRVLVMTMVQDEADMLPRWIEYYGAQVGRENLLVLDDNTTDGSTDGLPCPSYRLPPAPWKRDWGRTRLDLVNGLASGFLACYDVVVHTDVDEFLLPDPARYAGLRDYLAQREEPVLAPVAVDLLHHAASEPELDPERPVLEQRQLVKFVPENCKPLLKRLKAPWGPAFHAVKAPFTIDPELLLVHLKYYDVSAMRQVAQHRWEAHQHGRGSAGSAWPLGADELTSRLAAWTADADRGPVPDFDPAEPDLSAVVRARPKGFFRSVGRSVDALEQSPLRRLPQRFRHAV